MHRIRRACSCIKIRDLARFRCHERSLAQEGGNPRFVNAQQLSGKFAQGGRLGAVKVSSNACIPCTFVARTAVWLGNDRALMVLGQHLHCQQEHAKSPTCSHV